uniref:Uncharacterized protein n=1 Tax=Oryza nivara TaxID=4536 RepID=A0A0E0HLR7_ORYNI
MARRDKAFGAHGRDASFGSWWKKCFGAKARAEERARVRAGQADPAQAILGNLETWCKRGQVSKYQKWETVARCTIWKKAASSA